MNCLLTTISIKDIILDGIMSLKALIEQITVDKEKNVQRPGLHLHDLCTANNVSLTLMTFVYSNSSSRTH